MHQNLQAQGSGRQLDLGPPSGLFPVQVAANLDGSQHIADFGLDMATQTKLLGREIDGRFQMFTDFPCGLQALGVYLERLLHGLHRHCRWNNSNGQPQIIVVAVEYGVHRLGRQRPSRIEHDGLHIVGQLLRCQVYTALLLAGKFKPYHRITDAHFNRSHQHQQKKKVPNHVKHEGLFKRITQLVRFCHMTSSKSVTLHQMQ